MILLINGSFWINGSFDNPAQAILLDNGKIAQVLYELPENISEYRVVDLMNSFAYPGFIDTHTHSFEGGLYSLMIDLSNAKDLSEVFARINDGIQKTKPDDIVFAWNFDETTLLEKRYPTRAEIDSIVSDRSFVLRRRDGHSCLVNSHACNKIRNNAHSAKCDLNTDVFKGFDNDRIVHWFHTNVGDELVLKAYKAAEEIALRGGFGTIHTMVGDANDSIGHYKLLKENLSSFLIDYILYPQSFNIDAALEVGAERIGGCILADGSIGSYTAALYEPYQGLPIRGNLYQSDQFWREFITKAHQHNLQVGVHCIGDRAIAQINSVYMELANSDFKDLRHQLIHCEITDDAMINHIKASAAVPVMQPQFDHFWGGDHGFYAKLLGFERSRIMNRFGSMLKNRVKITGSSDWYITPLDVTKSLSAALNHHNVAERLDPAQAIDIYTKNAAWLSHDEKLRGEIVAGKDADFTITNYNISDGIDLDTAKVLGVIKRGSLVYGKF